MNCKDCKNALKDKERDIVNGCKCKDRIVANGICFSYKPEEWWVGK